MSGSRIHYAYFSQSLEITMRVGFLTVVYAFGESALQPSDLLSEGGARQTQARCESLSVFDLLTAAEPGI